MSSVDPTEARFPHVAAGAGHYESFYLKACHPHEPLGVWIRYTVHKRPGAAPTGSLWFTLFDAAAGGPRAQKVTVAGPRAGERRAGSAWGRPRSARAGPRRALDGIDWELRFESAEEPLFHLPRDWMYRARLPRTKLLSPAPAARFDGSLTVDGRAARARRLARHGGPQLGRPARRALDLAARRDRGGRLARRGDRQGQAGRADDALGRATARCRWAATRHALGGPGRRRRASARRPSAASSRSAGAGLRVRGEVSAPRKDFVGWVYADPDGSEHNAINCSIADLRLRVEPSGDRSSWCAAGPPTSWACASATTACRCSRSP